MEKIMAVGGGEEGVKEKKAMVEEESKIGGGSKR